MSNELTGFDQATSGSFYPHRFVAYFIITPLYCFVRVDLWTNPRQNQNYANWNIKTVLVPETERSDLAVVLRRVLRRRHRVDHETRTLMG